MYIFSVSHGCEKPVKKVEKKKTGENDTNVENDVKADLIVGPYCAVCVMFILICRLT